MTQFGGARTIVAGGIPSPGPMQATGITRGAEIEFINALDDDFSTASELNSRAASLLPNRADLHTYIVQASINHCDELQPKITEPLQFKYLPVASRVYYALANIYNFERLWQDAANALLVDQPSAC